MRARWLRARLRNLAPHPGEAVAAFSIEVEWCDAGFNACQ